VGESTAELILGVLRSKLERAMAANKGYSMAFNIESLERLITVATEMEQAGIWDTAYTYCLCHRDLEPRNIPGILDWDGALFAPLVQSCRPPMWLWAWGDNEEDDYRLVGEIPPTLEDQEIKRVFEEAAGPIYTQFAYRAGYRLARKLIRWIIDGVHSNEYDREVDRFHEEWARWKGGIPRQEQTSVVLTTSDTGRGTKGARDSVHVSYNYWVL